MEYIEVSAETVEAAITKATVDLGLTSDQIDIQVISEGNAGFLGFGKKPAVIKVCRKADLEEEERALRLAEEEAERRAKEEEKRAQREAKKAEQRAAKKEKEAAAAEEKETVQEEVKTEAEAAEKPVNRPAKKNTKKQDRKKSQPAAAKDQKEEEVKKPVKERKIPQKTDEEIEQMKAAAMDFLQGIFKAMDIETDIIMNYDAQEGCLNAEFTGEDMGVLIGKRGQTLDSLQYLTSLVINKDNKDEYVRVKLDTEDYRRRRKETLENLAKNIANKVKKTGKTVVLEPMNPYERRIIHSALQPNKSVETFSEGSEPYRHVVVKPVRNKQQ